ncbi:uncharacterized protein LOC120347298 isoform X1 [Styela clava]
MGPKRSKRDKEKKTNVNYIGRYCLDNVNIGYGEDTKTFLALHQITRSKVVVKIAALKDKCNNEGIEKLHHVARILSQVRHPHVIRLYEILQIERRLYAIVLELAAGGTLEQYVKLDPGYLSEEMTKYWLRQLVSALCHLHDRGVVHRNLHPSAILLDDKRKYLKISEFSYAYNCRHESAKHSRPMKIHSFNNAPELSSEDDCFNPMAIDIWSLGVLTFFMLNGAHPFPGKETPNNFQPPRDWKTISPECQDLICRMLEYRWDRRASLLEIETHEWMAKEPDHTYHNPPPRNNILRNVVLQKLSRIFKVELSQLQARVHEYRVDEFSAMANLMMDDYLAMKDECDSRHKTKTPIPAMKTTRSSCPNNHALNGLDGCGDVKFSLHSYIEGKRVDFRKTTKHRRCQSALHEQTYKLQPSVDYRDNTNAIPVVRSEISPRTFTNNTMRPLGNATSYNMAVARNLYQSKNKCSSNISPRSHRSFSARTVEDTVKIQKMKPVEKISVRTQKIPIGRRCSSAFIPRGGKGKRSAAENRPKSCSRSIKVKIQNFTNVEKPENNESTLHKKEITDLIINNNNSMISVCGDTPVVNIRERFADPTSIKHNTWIDDQPKMTKSHTPTEFSSSHVPIKSTKSANSIVSLSPSVITLNAKGIAENWKMCSGSTAPIKKLIRTTKKPLPSNACKRKACKPRLISARENQHSKKSTATGDLQINANSSKGKKTPRNTKGDQDNHIGDYIERLEVTKSAGGEGLMGSSELDEQKATERMKRKCIEILSKSPQVSSPSVKKIFNKTTEESSIKINDLYQMLSQDLDIYLSRKVLPKSSSLFLTSSNAAVAEYLGRTPPQTRSISKPQRPSDTNNRVGDNWKSIRKYSSPCVKTRLSQYTLQDSASRYESSYSSQTFRSSESKPRGTKRYKSTSDIKRSSETEKRRNTKSAYYKSGKTSSPRQLGDVPLGNNVSTCTACDLQDLIPMTMVTSSFFVPKKTDDREDDTNPLNDFIVPVELPKS